MSPELFALLERIHGHLAVLGLALLLHPVITLRTRRGLNWRTHLTAELGAALLAIPFAIGWAIYPAYRTHVKPSLFAAESPAFHAFETKEHLAAMAVFLAVGGAVALRAAGKTPAGRSAALVDDGAGLVARRSDRRVGDLDQRGQRSRLVGREDATPRSDRSRCSHRLLR